jgi:meiotically up-regulated gene 157 (Mug157) protein
MRIQQRKHGLDPYRFQRTSKNIHRNLASRRLWRSNAPVGLITSGFRPSDDACTFPFLVPSNLFAVTALGYLSQMANQILQDSTLSNEAATFASEVTSALEQHAVAQIA